MTNILDALTSISLEKYSEGFIALGFATLEDLMVTTPAELEKILTDIGMLKGHTFKLKKMIEDAKLGNLPKPQSQPPKPAPPKPKPETPSAPKFDLQKPLEANSKDLLDKVVNVKSQCSTILLTRDSLINSLKQFLEIDLNPYFEALNQLRTMQQSVRNMLQGDVDMSN
jgi:hypothetical protein